MSFATNTDIFLLTRCDINNSSPDKAVHHALYLLPQQDVHQHDTGPDHCLSHSGDSYPGEPDLTEPVQAKESLRPEGVISRYRYGWHGNPRRHTGLRDPDGYAHPCPAHCCCSYKQARTVV